MDEVDDGLFNHAGNMLECMKTRKRPACDIEDGQRSSATCLLGVVALRTRERIEFDPVQAGAEERQPRGPEALRPRVPRALEAERPGRLTFAFYSSMVVPSRSELVESGRRSDEQPRVLPGPAQGRAASVRSRPEGRPAGAARLPAGPEGPHGRRAGLAVGDRGGGAREPPRHGHHRVEGRAARRRRVDEIVAAFERDAAAVNERLGGSTRPAGERRSSC